MQVLSSFPSAGRELACGLQWFWSVKVNTLGTSLLFWCHYTSSLGQWSLGLGLWKWSIRTEQRPEAITEPQCTSQHITGAHSHGLTLLSACLFLPAYGFELPQERTEASFPQLSPLNQGVVKTSVSLPRTFKNNSLQDTEWILRHGTAHLHPWAGPEARLTFPGIKHWGYQSRSLLASGFLPQGQAAA